MTWHSQNHFNTTLLVTQISPSDKLKQGFIFCKIFTLVDLDLDNEDVDCIIYYFYYPITTVYPLDDRAEYLKNPRFINVPRVYVSSGIEGATIKYLPVNILSIIYRIER